MAINANTSFPVGKVDFIELHPLDFDKFLRGTGESPLADLILQQDWSLIASYSDRLVELLRHYMFVGGMLEVVARYAENRFMQVVRAIQLNILRGYENDFAKYASPVVSRRMAEVWLSLPSQLARENKSFVLGHVRDGARTREFQDAIQWLTDAELIHRVPRYTKPTNPVRAYEDAKNFKLFLHDIGLLGAMAGLEASVLLRGSGIFEEFKGALTEQYVLQQIIAARSSAPMYWAPDDGRADLDFSIERSAYNSQSGTARTSKRRRELSPICRVTKVLSLAATRICCRSAPINSC